MSQARRASVRARILSEKDRELDWSRYVADEVSFSRFSAGAVVVDVGCGTGDEVEALRASRVKAVGLDPYTEALSPARDRGLPVARAIAEALPLATGSVDGIVCKVVIPYTDEARALAEIARVLRPGGTARVSYHGSGYYLRCAMAGAGWRTRVYGLRTLLNSSAYTVFRRRLPGWVGDSLAQSRRRLGRIYSQRGLRLVADHSARRFLGMPVFIYHDLERTSGV